VQGRKALCDSRDDLGIIWPESKLAKRFGMKILGRILHQEIAALRFGPAPNAMRQRGREENGMPALYRFRACHVPKTGGSIV
jgi:hypothetical protein